ncbi:uncharacterized protein LOC143902261 isoform X2 [Temnothorax americanus]|uniref:uncharacterized protein LOC143902261 isoform X2 n=1 Tax=Temnothorax americanus TaxID=1964332 RepID=UPI004067F500
MKSSSSVRKLTEILHLVLMESRNHVLYLKMYGTRINVKFIYLITKMLWKLMKVLIRRFVQT